MDDSMPPLSYWFRIVHTCKHVSYFKSMYSHFIATVIKANNKYTPTNPQSLRLLIKRYSLMAFLVYYSWNMRNYIERVRNPTWILTICIDHCFSFTFFGVVLIDLGLEFCHQTMNNKMNCRTSVITAREKMLNNHISLQDEQCNRYSYLHLN